MSEPIIENTAVETRFGAVRALRGVSAALAFGGRASAEA
jgi:hypothetical protein